MRIETDAPGFRYRRGVTVERVGNIVPTFRVVDTEDGERLGWWNEDQLILLEDSGTSETTTEDQTRAAREPNGGNSSGTGEEESRRVSAPPPLRASDAAPEGPKEGGILEAWAAAAFAKDGRAELHFTGHWCAFSKHAVAGGTSAAEAIRRHLALLAEVNDGKPSVRPGEEVEGSVLGRGR